MVERIPFTTRLWLVFILFLVFTPLLYARPVRGLWVECEGSNKTLSSPERIRQLIEISKLLRVDSIFVQVYRDNRAWYNTRIADPAPFQEFQRRYHLDPLAYLIRLAHEDKIEVHAWLNIYRIGKKLNTPVIKKMGKEAITKDGRGVSMASYKASRLPDGRYWLDPGSPAVERYNLSIIKELISQYRIDGIHLDYIRYPSLKPTPGSRFSNREDFGYGKDSVRRFKDLYGYSPLRMDLKDRLRTEKWDEWRRQQITGFVEEAYSLCKRAGVSLSCAVQPWISRAYLVSYQDWSLWIERGIVDFVVIMNYTTDRRLAYILSRLASSLSHLKPVYVGLGVYLMIDQEKMIYQQLKDCYRLGVKGIVLFSYDELLKNKTLIKHLKETDWFSA